MAQWRGQPGGDPVRRDGQSESAAARPPVSVRREEGEQSRDKSFTTTFVVDQTPDVAFAAINNVREWWSEDVEGPTDHLGGVFYRAGDVHRCT